MNRAVETEVYEMEELSATSETIPVFAASEPGNRNKAVHYSRMAFHQSIINEGTDDELVCRAYRETVPRKILFYFLVFVTVGLILLLFYWKPEWKVLVRGKACVTDVATHLVLRDRYKQSHVKVIKYLDPPHRLKLEDLDKIENKNDGDVLNSKNTAKQYLSLSDIRKYGLQSKRYFQHKFHKYLWHRDTFVPLRGLDCDTTVQQLRDMQKGLDDEDRPDRRVLFGVNSITIEITPLIILLFREILNPYYAFQLFAIIVWCVDEYYSLPAVLLFLSVVSISLSLYLTRKQNRMIHKMSSGSGVVRVLDRGKFVSRGSADLLPGDVIEIQDNAQDILWCDCVLLSGNCVVSESMLTGESVPVLKTPLVVGSERAAEKEYYDTSKHKQHTLYGGTKIVDVQNHEDCDLPKALVIRTGFYTEKGKMIASMLAPSPMDYKFYNDSLKFILVMAIIGFIGSVLTIAFLASLGADAGHIVKRVLDLITTVVPPGLPAALTVATIYAQRRLRISKIFCISPPRIAVSGQITCMCFDKTGTLTETDLKIWGVVPCTGCGGNAGPQLLAGENESKFYDTVHEYQKLPQYGSTGLECLNALAACHSLVNIDGAVVGDPIDLELFRATNWSFSKSENDWSGGCPWVTSEDNNLDDLALARIFQFNSVMQRMSVIARKRGREETCVYTKGAPETLVQRCHKATVPSNFEERLKFFTKQGYRVLALASRNLDNSQKDIRSMERNEVESNLNFLGLVVLANPLKPNTTETISALKSARTRTVMATGDNLETALYVARKCSMINEADKIVVVDARTQPLTDEVKISWILDNTKRNVETITISGTKHGEGAFEDQFLSRCHLAMTGETLDILRQRSRSLYFRVLESGTVFARMKPDHKRNLVEGLQEMKYIVGMCGDGANDCGALKAAHSGIAIAEVEASIVAPFTSMKKDISSCIKLIREGRAALVTSFGMIKFLCTYCFVQYFSLILLYTVNSYFSDNQFLFADIGVTGVVTLFFAVGGAAKTLSKKQPHSSLVSPTMLTCQLLQLALLVLFQASSFVLLQQQTSWHTRLVPNMTHPKQNVLCNENTVMFYTSSFQNMMLAFIFYQGLPHRQPLYRNVPYFIGFLIFMTIVVVIYFAPVEPLAEFFSLTQLNNEIGFKFMLLSLYVANLIFAVLIEKVLLESSSFKRVLKKISGKFRRMGRKGVSFDEGEDVSFLKVQRDLMLDASWPPIGQETNIKG